MADVPIIGEGATKKTVKKKAPVKKKAAVVDVEEVVESEAVDLNDELDSEDDDLDLDLDSLDDDDEMTDFTVDQLETIYGKLLAANQEKMNEYGLSLGRNEFEQRLNILQTQVRVLMDMMTETTEEKVLFRIACQKLVADDLSRSIEEIEAARMREMLTKGVGDALSGNVGGVDLSTLKHGNRQARRKAAQKAARDMAKKGL